MCPVKRRCFDEVGRTREQITLCTGFCHEELLNGHGFPRFAGSRRSSTLQMRRVGRRRSDIEVRSGSIVTSMRICPAALRRRSLRVPERRIVRERFGSAVRDALLALQSV